MIDKKGIMKLFAPTFRQIGLRKSDLEDLEANIVLPKISAEIEMQLKTTGIDVGDIEKALREGTLEIQQPEGFFLYKKRPIFLYIRDQRLTEDRIQAGHYDRVHVCFCKALEEAREEHRFSSRYVASFRRDGIFPVNIYERYTQRLLAENQQLELTVCQDCLEKLNWHGFAPIRKKVKSFAVRGPEYYQTKQQLYKIVDHFSMQEFLTSAQKKIVASLQELQRAGLHTAASMPRKEYWLSPLRKARLKQAANYHCQVCYQDFAAEDLYIHHIDHNEGHNSPENLLVVCKQCHRAIHRKEGGEFLDDES